jgi:hypothetical protein
VHAVAPEVAVVAGFVGFVAALIVQFSRQRYVPWAYWSTVVTVGIFGTITEATLSVHDIDTLAPRGLLLGRRRQHLRPPARRWRRHRPH